jgi:hypothetical protein
MDSGYECGMRRRQLTAGDGDEPDEEEVLEREHPLPLRVQAVHPAPGAPRPVRPPLLRQQRLPQRRRGSSSAAAAAAATHLRAPLDPTQGPKPTPRWWPPRQQRRRNGRRRGLAVAARRAGGRERPGGPRCLLVFLWLATGGCSSRPSVRPAQPSPLIIGARGYVRSGMKKKEEETRWARGSVRWAPCQ